MVRAFDAEIHRHHAVVEPVAVHACRAARGERLQHGLVEPSLRIVRMDRGADFGFPAGALEPAVVGECGGHVLRCGAAFEARNHAFLLQLVALLLHVLPKILAARIPVLVESAGERHVRRLNIVDHAQPGVYGGASREVRVELGQAQHQGEARQLAHER